MELEQRKWPLLFADLQTATLMDGALPAVTLMTASLSSPHVSGHADT